jgi:hypothetical protein
MSSSGPAGPIFFGVWQSLQPPIFTKCSPHFSWLSKPPYCILTFMEESALPVAAFSRVCSLQAIKQDRAEISKQAANNRFGISDSFDDEPGLKRGITGGCIFVQVNQKKHILQVNCFSRNKER